MPRIFYFVVVVVFCMLPDFANAQAKPKRDISNDRSVSVARSAPKKNVTNQTARKNSTMHSSVEAYAVMSVDGTILTFYCDGNKIARKGVVYGLNQEYDFPGWCEVNDSKDIIPSKVKIVIFDNSFKAAHPISCFCWFAGFEKLIKIVGLENLNTSNVTDMSEMFRGCSSLKSLDVRGFNTSNVTYMRGMFYGCSNLTSLDVRGFNTSKLANMEYMFANCGNLKEVYVGNGWNIKSIKGHESIFEGSQNAGFVRR